MKYMTHNSWTFMRPKTFLGRIFNFMAQCQEINIQQQYEKYNVRMFDLRIRLKNGSPIIAHGLFEYQDSINQIVSDLDFLNNKKDVYVKVQLEIRNPKQDLDIQRFWFVNYCKQLESMYQNIKFCGGNPVYNSGLIYYKFKNEIPSTKGCHASNETKNILDDLYPKLYAKKHNKESKKRNITQEFLSLDFINYG